MDEKQLFSTLSKLNKISVSNLSHSDLNIYIYWFRAVGYKFNRYVMTSRMHHHTFFELHFIFSGSITYKIDDRIITVKKGEYLLIPPSKAHMVMDFSEDFIKLSAAFSLKTNTGLYLALIKKSGTVYPMYEDMEKSVEFILSVSSKNAFYSSALIKNRLLEIICLIAGDVRTAGEISHTESEYDEHLFRAKKYISDNINIFLTCNDVAQYCHISPKQLRRIFIKYENISLLKYIHDRKILEAQRLLTSTKKTLNEISASLGFSNEYYFNHFFSKHTGMTPGDYRKAQPNNNNNKNN